MIEGSDRVLAYPKMPPEACCSGRDQCLLWGAESFFWQQDTEGISTPCFCCVTETIGLGSRHLALTVKAASTYEGVSRLWAKTLAFRLSEQLHTGLLPFRDCLTNACRLLRTARAMMLCRGS